MSTAKPEIYQLLVNTSQDCIISEDIHGTITTWNKGAERLLGFTANEMTGQSMMAILPGGSIAEDKKMVDLARHGISTQLDTWWLTKLGAPIKVSTTISPINDEQEKVIGISRISRRASNGNTSPNADNEDRIYRALAEHIPNAFVTVVGRDLRYTFVSGEKLIAQGINPHAMVGAKDRDVWGIRPGYEQIAAMRTRAFEGETVTYELSSGHEVYLLRLAPLVDENNKIDAVLTIAQNISEQKHAERQIKSLNELLEKKVAERTAQLEATNGELEAFSFSVSHDLRAPLRIIHGYVDILEAEYRDKLGDEGGKLLDIIRRSTQKMKSQIEALLDLSTLGRKELSIKKQDINTMVQDIADEQRATSKKDIHFNISELLPCDCDEDLILHVWSNLIGNAIKYSRNSDVPTININSKAIGNSTLYSISDNGVGFDMNYSHKLFGVFQRLHKQSDFEGTGIGLALVQRIVNKHGGKVWAEAEPGKGATFYFTIPNRETT